VLPLRPYTPLRMVLTVCGRCFAAEPDRAVEYERDILQGNLILMDGKVYLRRVCRRGHGEVISLYEEDYALWESLQQWRVPTRQVIPDTAGNDRPIPMGYAAGLGELQTQHSCILLLDVTENCNLHCPTCFAGSGPGLNRYARAGDLLRTLDACIAREGGRLDVLMLSGGEPTVHPEIATILREAAARPVTRVLLNTNGVRVARDDRFAALLGELRGRLEVYLQFDGFARATHRYHRGEDLRALKAEAVGRLTGQRVFTTLAMAVAAGVNDGEVGAVADYALATDYVGGVAFQPVFGAGRANPIDPLDRVTTTGVLRRLGEQTGGRVGPADFIALPCSHPDCCAIGYFVRGDAGQLNSVARRLGVERLKANLGLVANRIAADESALGQALLGMMSETTTVSRPELIDYVLTLCESCDLGVRDLIRGLGDRLLGRAAGAEPISRRLKRFTVKSFMDAWTLNIERLQQCCVHVGAIDGGREPVRIPFCARQLFGELRGVTTAGMVPVAEVARRSRPEEVR
jgi:uncharacterized radical SAM superfamily Fe-S cluster-containing enzyme